MRDALIDGFAPLKAELYRQLVHFAPRLAVALIVLAVAWATAKMARWAAGRTASAEWLERLSHRSGLLSSLVEPPLNRSGGNLQSAVYSLILLAGVASAFALISDSFALFLRGLVHLVPRILLAISIIVVAWWIGGFWARTVLIRFANEGLACPWRWAALVRCATIIAGIALASEATGFATALVRGAFLILLAGATFGAVHAATPALRVWLNDSLSANDRHNPPARSDDPVLR